jgi:3-hydroxypropanoate dehydrogenase
MSRAVYGARVNAANKHASASRAARHAVRPFLEHPPMINDHALDALFRNARTQNGYLPDHPVSDEQLRAVYDLAKWGPTSANCSPMRIVFVRSTEAKAQLKPLLLESNRSKVEQAPVTAIIGQDLNFYEHLPKLFPHTDARSWFVGNAALIESTAFRNSSLQGAYFMLAARACGLDCGPMSGFNADKVNEAFFAGTDTRVNFICTLGTGDPSKVFARSPRFGFDEVCSVR